jgi:hypothetical protein
MNEELAKRAVACKHWRWMAGMALMGDTLQGKSKTRGTRAIGSQRQHPMGVGLVCYAINLDGERGGYLGALPDLDDPATLGCLLALVRGAWQEPTLFVQAYGSTWSVCSEDGDLLMNYSTEGEALVAALEHLGY